MTSVERVIELVKFHDLDWPYTVDETRILRTRAGRWQLAAGAWRWMLYPTPDAPSKHLPEIGSGYKLQTLLDLKPEQTCVFINRFGQIELMPK